MDNSETLAPFGDKRHRTKTNKTKHRKLKGATRAHQIQGVNPCAILLPLARNVAFSIHKILIYVSIYTPYPVDTLSGGRVNHRSGDIMLFLYTL
jgi:hypothetical protein